MTLSELAREWAILDGCEGGDLLVVLADALDMAPYSYYDKEILTTLLERAIKHEISAHEEMVEKDPERYGYDPEAIAEFKRRCDV